MSSPRDDPSAQAEATQWLARRSHGGLGAEDQRAFLAWLDASAANQQAYAQAQALWETLRDLDQVAPRQLAQARSFLQRRRQPPRGRRLAMALAMTALAAVGGLWLAGLHGPAHDATYRTVLGQRRVIDLPDGSRLELNTSTEASVHFSRHARQIRLLQGQAVFTVAHDPERPFDVLVEHGRVRDISTQFEVRRWPDRTTVAVLDGTVDVFPAAGATRAAPARLTRGQSIGIDRAGALSAPQAIDLNTHAAWRDGRIAMQNQPLREVLQELGRYHGGSITVGRPHLLDLRLSGIVPTDDLALALRTVAAALPARLHQTGPQAWRLDPM